MPDDAGTPEDLIDDTVHPELVIITGMSGAGRTRAAAVLEDLDWYVVDNLPPQMLAPLADLMSRAGGVMRRLAVVVDVRGREFFNDLNDVLDQLRVGGVDYRILYLEASDESLIRRFEQVRRPHPLEPHGRLSDGIAQERQLLEDLRSRADVVIDTTDLTVHELAKEVTEIISADGDQPLRVTIMSFGFKHGLPLDADHVADVRFLANPFWVEELRHHTGLDDDVREYVLASEGTYEFLDRYLGLFRPVFAGYVREHKRFVTIAIGCTGGRHRSVSIAEEMSHGLRDMGHRVRVVHRDVGKE